MPRFSHDFTKIINDTIDLFVSKSSKENPHITAHAVIDYIFENFNNEYMNEYKKQNYSDTETFHSNISKEIKKDLRLTKVGTEYSRNIRNNFSKATVYKIIN